MKKYTTFFALLLSLLIANAQTTPQSKMTEIPPLMPPSPNASSLAMFADYPVSHYTGTPNINIPLYEISIDNLKIPIALSYHASGIKVSQEASWVGLGWSLSAGGNISRTVKCGDDFKEYPSPAGIQMGYYKGPAVNSASSAYYEYVYPNSYRLIIDSEPDIFFYSLPGYSGKFLLDKSRGAILFDKTHNIKVDVIEDRVNGYYFILTSPDGTQYTYNKRETAKSYSSEGGLAAGKLDDTPSAYLESPMEYASSWYLTKILTNNKREVIFTYEKEILSTLTQVSCVKYNVLSSYSNEGSLHSSIAKNVSTPYSTRSKQVQENWRLSKISWDNGYINFVSSTREDLTGTNSSYLPRKLDKINIYDKNNTYIRGFEFIYSYFNNEATGTYKYVYKRLKLDKIREINKSQQYANQGYTLSYFAGSLPIKNSKNTDYWGYHNGKEYGSNYYVGAYRNDKIYNGADKSSNLTYLKIGTLSEIKYPTGGSAQFSYEENTFSGDYFNLNVPIVPQKNPEFLAVYNYYQVNTHADLPSKLKYKFEVSKTTQITIRGNLENQNCGFKDPDYFYYGGGLNPLGQLRKISPTTKTYYTYECPYLFLRSGTEVAQRGEGCEHIFTERLFTLDAGVYEFEAYTPPKDVTAEWWIKNLATVNPPTPGNTIHKGGGLRISQIKTDAKTRKFTYPTGTLLVEPVLSYATTLNYVDGSYHCSATYLVQVSESARSLASFSKGNFVGYNYVEESVIDGASTSKARYDFYNTQEDAFNEHYPFMPTTIEYKNGLPKSISYYSNGSLVNKVDYSYSSKFSNTVPCFIYHAPSNQAYIYNYKVEYLLSSAQTSTTTGINTSSNIVEKTGFIYNDYFQPKSQYYTFGDYPYSQETRYATDFSDNVSRAMLNKHMINLPVETFTDRDDYVTQGQKTTYKDTLGMILPSVISSVKTKKPISIGSQASYYTPDLYFDLYNSYGKVMQLRDNNYSTVYIWSYNGEYPIAEIKNATYAEVRDALGGETFVSGLSKKFEPAAADWTKIEGLRTNANLKKSMVTIYKYKPLVGVTEISDPRGVSTFYGYDDCWRLKEIYIMENNVKKVLENFVYHYQNQ